MVSAAPGSTLPPSPDTEDDCASAFSNPSQPSDGQVPGWFLWHFKKILCLFLAPLGLRCCSGFSLVFIWKLLIAMTSLVAELGLQGSWASVIAAPGLQSSGSIVAAHGLICAAAHGTFPDQELNLCLLHWQADSLPQSHQGSPVTFKKCIQDTKRPTPCIADEERTCGLLTFHCGSYPLSPFRMVSRWSLD